MPQAVALPVVAGISAVTGLLGSRPKTTTSTPIYTTDQQSMQHNLSDWISSRMNNPGAVFDPMKAAAMDSVNKNYQSLGARLQSQFSGRGFGRSGTLLTNRIGQEVARAGDLGGLESKFSGMQLDYENQLADMAQRFGFASPGTSTTQPGNMAGGGFGAGAQTLTSLWTLNKLLSGGGPFGGGGGGGGNYSGDVYNTDFGG